MNIVPISVELMSHTPEPEKLIELAARNCYKSEDCMKEDGGAFVRRIIHQHKHQSVAEFADAVFKIVCDRATLAQLTRHRHHSFAAESQRYCNYSKDKFDGEVSMLMPVGLPEGPATYRWHSSSALSESTYLDMLDIGVPPETARSVLPNCTATTVFMKGNFRSWLQFLDLRTKPQAQADIRRVAELIQEHLILIAPNVFGNHE